MLDSSIDFSVRYNAIGKLMRSNKENNRCGNAQGFTLLELMIVVGIVGVLALIAVTAYKEFILRSKLTETATQLGAFARAFESWKQVNDRYPDDTHLVLPDAPGLPINIAQWTASTQLGGNWNWEGPDNYGYAGISITGITAPVEDIMQFDTLLDDGNLSTGKFRRTANGRYTFILAE